MSKRKQKLHADIRVFLKQYARKAHAGHDPNDRQYDRRIEGMIKRMRPEELDELMNGSDEMESPKQEPV